MRFRLVLGALLATLATLTAFVTSPVSASGHDRNTVATYTITVENLTGGQYLTPPNFAAHDRSADVFSAGQPASPGVQAVAENGAVPTLAAELTAAIDDAGLGTSGVGAADPISPGQSITFDVTSSERRLSIVAMVICTNDGFAGLDSRPLPARDGQTRTYYLRAYDAGTEINTEARQDLVPAPFCGEGEGTDMTNPDLAENSVIRNHPGIQGIGDLDPAQFGWNGPVAKLTVTRNG